MKIWSWHDVLNSSNGFLDAVEIKTVGLSMLRYWRFLLEGNAKYESVCLEHSQLELLIYELVSTHLSGPMSCTQLTGPSLVQGIKLLSPVVRFLLPEAPLTFTSPGYLLSFSLGLVNSWQSHLCPVLWHSVCFSVLVTAELHKCTCVCVTCH